MKLLKPKAIQRRIKAKFAPVNVSPLTLNEVLSQYNLGNLKKVSVPGAGQRSKTFIIKTKRGSFALKAYTSALDEPAILFEHSIIQFLQSADYPTPGLVENRFGQTLTSVADRHYVCYEFVEGRRYSDYFLSRKTSEQVLAQSGQALARYHRLITGFEPMGCKTDGFRPGTRERWDGKDWYLNELALAYPYLFSETGVSKIPLITDQWSALESKFVALYDKLEGDNPASLPVLPIHGDFGPYNLFFKDDKLTAVLDFECAHLDWRLADVLAAIVRFARRRRNGLDQEKATMFLKSYQAIWPLEAVEVEAVVPVFTLACYRNMIRDLRRYRLTGLEHWLKAATALLAQIELADALLFNLR